MSLTSEQGEQILRRAGAKITKQRMAIMRALIDRRDHPSAEQLYEELKPQHPRLSMATVYHTVQLLSEASVLRTLTINDKRVSFDPSLEPHAHFMCSKCRTIIDVPVNNETVLRISGREDISTVECIEVFYYGTCSNCSPIALERVACRD